MSDLDFGYRVRARRHMLGISQDDLGKAVGVSQVAIRKIEAGGNTRHGRKIAAALETTLQWLETGIDAAVDHDGAMSSSEQRSHGHASPKPDPRPQPSAPPWPLKKSTAERIRALTPAQQRRADDAFDVILKGFEAEGK
ncbi:helix-turn-helix domain-containing protein [Castellaniella ginsengisoli]|uniref:Helix-turn-helix domain-containing protein n=1 Tax=Castellaniella ginsengisoli TaxID=546114 RepID=A0AB39CT34_9BURK